MIYYTPIDFAVICALEEELSALLKVFGIERKNNTRMGSLKTWSTIFHGKHIRIVVLEDVQGVLSAGVAAAELLHAWAPWCIVSVGIAGRALVDDEKIRLCDVVVATSVEYYEPGKLIDRKDGTPEFLMDLRSFETEASSFANCLNIAANECTPARVKQGKIMSGEKKIAGKHNYVKKVINDAHRKALAIEMEAAGVGGALNCFEKKVGVGLVKFLVVKGLSDDAGHDESDAGRRGPISELNADTESETAAAKTLEAQEKAKVNAAKRIRVRKKAAMNAAKALAAFVKEAVVTLQISPKGQEFRTQAESTANSLVTSLLPIVDLDETVAPLAPNVENVSPSDVIRIAVSDLMRRAKMMPPLFVHWRIRPNFHPLHWLDFATMLRLRRATNGVEGVPYHVLLSDNEQIGDAERKEAEAMIKQVMPSDTRINWLSQARYQGPLIDTYIGHLGSGTEFVGLPFEFTRKPEYFWMKYIVWATHGIGSCFLLAWKKAFPIWGLLSKVYSRQVLILHRRTLYLGGAEAKSEMPGRDILISPPTYEHLVECIRRLPDAVLTELVQHLSLEDEKLLPIEGRESLIIQTHSNLMQTLDANRPAYKLLQLMHHWNSVYFACKA